MYDKHNVHADMTMMQEMPRQRMVAIPTRQFSAIQFPRAIPTGKTPGAGQRVKMDRRRKQGEEYLDTLPGDLQ
jgi:hypothetical protein